MNFKKGDLVYVKYLGREKVLGIIVDGQIVKEKNIILQALIEMGADKDELNEIIIEAEKKEKDSNQILDFTREVKNISEDEKKVIIEALWKIIYSDENADMYETNLMRRLSGLLYLDSKVVGDLKEKVKKNL